MWETAQCHRSCFLWYTLTSADLSLCILVTTLYLLPFCVVILAEFLLDAGVFVSSGFLQQGMKWCLTEVSKLWGADSCSVMLWFLWPGWALGEHGEWAKYSNFDVTTRVPLMFYVPGKTAPLPVEGAEVFPLPRPFWFHLRSARARYGNAEVMLLLDSRDAFCWYRNPHHPAQAFLPRAGAAAPELMRVAPVHEGLEGEGIGPSQDGESHHGGEGGWALSSR